MFLNSVYFPVILYNPETMPGNLRRAHEKNDETLDASISVAASETIPKGWRHCLRCTVR
ncbi:MAG: hypothetical protein PSN37_03270 [Alphaproteobacteria bacterium]|nr:hypothetical protein [Alphaproteobacteria bacterium]